MFIGREPELEKLNLLYASEKFEMAIVYGRRRVGKSELLNHFCRDKKTVFFTAIESSSSLNLTVFTEAIIASGFFADGAIPYLPRDFMQALDLVAAATKSEKVIFVIDEYPYVAKAEKPFSSLLQKYIDTTYKNANMMLILCGSSMHFMERQVLSNKSPLYGRRTAQFKIEPFNYYDAARFVPSYSAEDKLLTYGILGGTPYYLAQMDTKQTLRDNILSLFFTKTGLLFEEPNNLIKQELREPQIYNAIITAIANGATRLGEISNKLNKPTNLCETYIKKLIALGLILKEHPLSEKSSSKSIYVLSDNMFRFWFYYVQKALPLIAQGLGDKAVKQIFPKGTYENGSINEYMGRAFETVCIQYLWKNYDALPINPTAIGRWWGNNSIEKQEEEIDILAIDSDCALFGECKFRNDKTDMVEYEKLVRKSKPFVKFPTKYYYLFSKSGFTESLIQLSMSDNKVRLITLSDFL